MKKIMENIKYFFASGYYRIVVFNNVKKAILSLPGIKQIYAWLQSRK